MLEVCDPEAVWEKLDVVFLAVLHDVMVPLGSLGDGLGATDESSTSLDLAISKVGGGGIVGSTTSPAREHGRTGLYRGSHTRRTCSRTKLRPARLSILAIGCHGAGCGWRNSLDQLSLR